jgi:ribonuclease HII
MTPTPTIPNIYWAAMEARRRAVEALPTTPAHILVDGKRRIAGCRVPQTAVVDGDALSASIAAASIVAKVTRVSIMQEYTQLHPGYGFERHKGYGTMDHISVLTRLGPLPLHRWSFEAVWRAAQPQLQFGLAKTLLLALTERGLGSCVEVSITGYP